MNPMRKIFIAFLIFSAFTIGKLHAETIIDMPIENGEKFTFYVVDRTDSPELPFDLPSWHVDTVMDVAKYWLGVIDNAKGTSFLLMSEDEKNASAASSLVILNGGNSEIVTMVQSDILGKDWYQTYDAESETWISDEEYYENSSGSGLILIGTFSFQEPYTNEKKPFLYTEYPDLRTIMVHEFGHAFGISATTFSTTGYLLGSNWDNYLTDGRTTADGEIITVGATIKEGDETIAVGQNIAMDDFLADDAHFIGENTIKVLGGNETSYKQSLQNIKDNEVDLDGDGLIDSYGLVHYQNKDRTVNGLPINGFEDGDLELSHIELRNCLMSHQTYRNWFTFMEAELATLQDIGYNIDRKQFFGKSYYLNNITEDNMIGFNSSKDYGVGLHLYGDNNKITQVASINSTGDATIGARIDGVGNDLTIKSGNSIDLIGKNSIGIAVTYGKEHEITVEENSTVSSSGQGGIGVSFDFDSNIFGQHVLEMGEHRGSYFAVGLRFDPETGEYFAADIFSEDDFFELNGALVDKFDIKGTIIGEKAAIYISDNALVNEINVYNGATIQGDIVSNWNQRTCGIFNSPDSFHCPDDSKTELNWGTDSSRFVGDFGHSIIAPEKFTMNVKNADLTLTDTKLVALQDLNISSSSSLNNNSSNVNYLINNTFLNDGDFTISENSKTALTINDDIEGLGTITNNGVLSLNTLQPNTITTITNDVVLTDNSTFNLLNNSIQAINIDNTLELNGQSNIYLDLDLTSNSIDNLTVDTLTTTNPSTTGLTLAGLNVMNSKTALTNPSYDFSFITVDNDSQNLLENITLGNTSEILTPIFKYQPNYIYNGNRGTIGMSRGSSSDWQSYNPSVLATPIATQIGGYLTQINNYQQAFHNMDMTMLMTRNQRQAMKFANKYATIQANNLTFGPNQIPEEQRGLWYRPFASFEKVGLDNGPKVENVLYGSLFGADSDLIELSRGWDMTYSLYAGYTGSHQNYSGTSIYQNGGVLGGSTVFYKGNFFTGLTANVGANVGQASTMFGNDDFTMLMSGIASKTGYNLELADSKFIIQPSWLMSYSFVNTFDYTNSSGVRIDSNSLHAIQLVPGLKFIGNLKNGWQPYASVQMVWNLLDQTRFSANNVSLPNMSVKPYVQYGLGLQKRWGEKFTAFGQAMLRNGGINGIALQFGLRWTIGK